MLEWGTDFHIWTFLSLKKEQFQTEEQQEYFSWSAASAHNASFSSQGRRRLGPGSSAGVCSSEPARYTYPLVLWSTKPPACQAQHKCLLHHSPATCDFSCHCSAKPPSRAKGRLLWPGSPTTVWRQETTVHSQSSSPRSMKLNSSAA